MKIVIEPNEFIYFLFALFVDKYQNYDQIIYDSDMFNTFVDKLKKVGLKPWIYSNYMKMPAIHRSKYRMFRNALKKPYPKAFSELVIIGKEKEPEIKSPPMNTSLGIPLVKKILNKAIQKANESVFSLSEEDIDLLIEDIIIDAVNTQNILNEGENS